jgi:hypothetical protein
MGTKFTMNTTEANAQSGKLLKMGATVFAQHETKPNGRAWGDQSLREVKFPLPAAMTFVTMQDISRTTLTKLFGKAAMVRGVKKI